MQLKNLIYLFLICSLTSYASIPCKPIPLLEDDFNYIDYKTCYHRLHLCPKLASTPFLDQACIKRTMELNKFCVQLKAISNVVETDPYLITIHDYKGKVAIVKSLYPADGGETYHILTAEKCLIPTNIDPRNLNASLKKRYKDFNFYTQNDGQPRVKFHSNSRISITTPIKVTDGCRACKTILRVNIKYDFTPSGRLNHATAQTLAGI